MLSCIWEYAEKESDLPLVNFNQKKTKKKLKFVTKKCFLQEIMWITCGL